MSKNKNIIYILITFSFLVQSIIARDPEPENGHFNIGQDTISSKDYANYFTDLIFLSKTDGSQIGFLHQLNYGFTRRFGVSFNLPFFLKQEQGDTKKQGLSDISVVTQFHFFRQPENLGVFKLGLSFPTGDSATFPPLGTGSFDIITQFLGIHSSQKWFASFGIGSFTTTPRKTVQVGTLIDYDISIGPKIQLRMGEGSANLYPFLELQGFYSFADKVNGREIPNTGGNLVLFGPVISIDTAMYQIIVRTLLPISYRRRGIQPGINYLFTVCGGFSF